MAAGGSTPIAAQPAGVIARPRAVFCTKPERRRCGSNTSSIVSSLSPTAAAIVLRPSGSPPLVARHARMRRSSSSSPFSSTPSRASASRASARVDRARAARPARGRARGAGSGSRCAACRGCARRSSRAASRRRARRRGSPAERARISLEVLDGIGREALERWPKRPRNGAESRPSRVVAPTSVKRLQRQRQDARVRALVEREVDLEVLHRRVEVLLDRGRHAVDLVDEEHVAARRAASGSRRGRAAARAPVRSSRGACAPSSRARMRARLVLPRPGGPESSTWSSGSPRARAAAIATRRFSSTRAWPTNSSKRARPRASLSNSRSGRGSGGPSTSSACGSKTCSRVTMLPARGAYTSLGTARSASRRTLPLPGGGRARAGAHKPAGDPSASRRAASRGRAAGAPPGPASRAPAVFSSTCRRSA